MDALASPASTRRASTPTPVGRHLLHFGPLLALSGLAAFLAYERCLPATSAGLRALYAAVVAVNVLALAMSTWSTLLGVATMALDRGRRARLGPVLRAPTGRARTAVLLPIYEEDVARVFSAAVAMTDSLAASPIGHVDLYVLSDSRSTAAIAAEDVMAARVGRSGGDGKPAILYRRRADNRGRKAGNVADFIERWGALYDFMVVLDADSLMTGEAIARLVGAMEANPRAGLIQAMCYPVGRHSLFARLQQVNARLYGPLFQRGVALWQGPRGNFWGHNAIVRVAAFAASCGLPVLPGRPPLGGEILSHDTVEAALMLRAGWDVWMLPDGPGGRQEGSWEETPTNLVDHLERDRRWCRGNLQHLFVLPARGLRLASLYHLTRGLLHYLYSPLAVAWLLLYAAVDRHEGPDGLVWLVLAMIAVPRLCCVVAAAWDGTVARGFGGRARLLAGAALDQLVLALVYPVALAFHLSVLVGVLTGGTTRWDAQSRDERGLPWGETARQLGPLVAVALLALAAVFAAAPWPAGLLAIGLAAAIPLAVLTSRRLEAPLFLQTPDDMRPHPLRLARIDTEAVLRSAAGAGGGAMPPLLPENGYRVTAQVLRPRRP